ncbi:MAG: divalent cation tolerance protein CutA [Pseudobdellovibrio sp.]
MGNLKKLTLLYVVYPKKEKKLKSLIRKLLKDGHIVCANVLEGMESYYIWNNKIETSQESIVVYKIKSEKVKEVSEIIEKNHPYEIPFVGVLDLKNVNKKYIDYAYLTT